jgi:hypothetical protein
MKLYYVNKVALSNGDHEVHAEDCHKHLMEQNQELGH